MNATLKSVFANCGFLMLATFAKAQVGIGTTSPDASARLQVDANSSTNAKGFLPPRVALQGTNDAQLTSPSTPTIANPATGLLVYNTVTAGSGATAVTPGFYYYSGSAWVRLSTGVSTVGSIAGSSNANGATINGNTITLTPADATNGGVVTTSSQTFSGAKTFSSNLSVNGVTIGRSPGGNNTNTVLGGAALGSNTSGAYNTAVGGSTLFYNTTGSHNFAGGQGALEQSVSGTNNVAIGSSALQNNVSGNDNSAFGVGALYSNTTGEKNTAVGAGANVFVNNLTNATALGYGATVAASNSVQLGNSNVTNVKTSGSITAGVVTYPNTDGTANQILKTNGNGILTWSTPEVAAANVTGTVSITNGGTGQTTLAGIKSTLGLAGANVAIGSDAGLTSQGSNAIAIGSEAGKTSQAINAIAIGAGAGRTTQGIAAIGIGYVTGDGAQGNHAIAIGSNAAQSNQSAQTVAIGYAAGQYNQGPNAVAIGAGAGQSNQVANSIAINATGESSPLNPTNAGLYINPIRTTATTSSFLSYDNSTKEVTSIAASTPTYIFCTKNSAQSILPNTVTTVTDWTNSVTLNASEWNATSGVFTATKAGFYSVSVSLTYDRHEAASVNAEYNVLITKISGSSTTYLARAWMFAESTQNIFKPTGSVTAIVQLSAGDQLSIETFQSSGATRSLNTAGNSLVIQELPSRIVR